MGQSVQQMNGQLSPEQLETVQNGQGSFQDSSMNIGVDPNRMFGGSNTGPGMFTPVSNIAQLCL